MVTRSEIAKFYDAFGQKLIRDYINQNRRLYLAIEFAKSRIPPGAKAVLDLGCGIGFSTLELSSAFPNSHFTGLDISNHLIEIAKRLFPRSNSTFISGDLFELEIDAESVDVVVMLDSYEHFPKSTRKELHSFLNRVLTRDGILVLTTPSPQHQHYLARENPSNLQIIDEVVTAEDLLALGADTGASLTCYQSLPVFMTNNYLYACLERTPVYEKVNRPSKGIAQKIKKRLGTWRRKRRVRSSLNIHNGNTQADIFSI